MVYRSFYEIILHLAHSRCKMGLHEPFLSAYFIDEK